MIHSVDYKADLQNKRGNSVSGQKIIDRNTGHLNTVCKPYIFKNPFPGFVKEWCNVPVFGNIDFQNPQLSIPSLSVTVFETSRKAVTPEQQDLSAKSEPLRSSGDSRCRRSSPWKVKPDPGCIAEIIEHKMNLTRKPLKIRPITMITAPR